MKQLDEIAEQLYDIAEQGHGVRKMVDRIFIQMQQLTAGTIPPTSVPVTLEVAKAKTVELAGDITVTNPVLTLVSSTLEITPNITGTTVKLSGLETDSYPASVIFQAVGDGPAVQSIQLSITKPATTRAIQHAPGDITKSAWDAFLATLPTDGTTGRPRPNGFNVNQAVATTAGRFIVGDQWEVPTMDAFGDLQAFAESVQHEKHNMVILGNLAGAFHPSHGGYMPYTTAFEMAAEFTLPDTLADYQNMPWILIWQLHPGTFPADWVGLKEPPLDVGIINGEWVVHHRGSADAAPTGYDHQTYSTAVPIAVGSNKLVARWTQDYTAATSYIQVLMNGVELHESTLTNGINKSGIGTGVPASICSLGNYHTVGSAYPDVHIGAVDVWRE